MPFTVDLPPDVERRLEAEAMRRGVTVNEVVAELADRLPAPGRDRLTPRPLSFVGIGASGDTRPFDIHREREEVALRARANGI